MTGAYQKVWPLGLFIAVTFLAGLFPGARPVAEIQAAGSRQYKLVMIPLHWQGSRQDFETSAARQASLFIESSNLDAYVDVQVVLFPESFTGSSLSKSDLPYKMLKFALEKEPADRYIGLTDGDLAPFGDSRIAGWTFGPGALAMVVEEQYFMVTAHELGHTFDLCDEYLYSEWKRQDSSWGCPNPYPPSCSHERHKFCFGQPAADGRLSIMGPAGRMGEYAFNEASYDHLQALFADMFDQANDNNPTTPTSPTKMPPPTPTAAPMPTPPPPAYQVRLAISNPDLLVVHPDGNIEQLAQGPVYHTAWAPSGQELTFVAHYSGNLDIYTLSLAGGEPKPILSWPSREMHPVWTADGQHLIFSSDKEGDFQLYILALADGTVQNFPNFPQPASWPSLSANGRQIAFAAALDGTWGIYTAAVNNQGMPIGGAPRRLSPPDIHAFAPAWHPSERKLAWSERDSAAVLLHIMDLDQGTDQTIVTGPGDWAPVWYDQTILLLQTVDKDQLQLTAFDSKNGQAVILPKDLPRGGWPAVFELKEEPQR